MNCNDWLNDLDFAETWGKLPWEVNPRRKSRRWQQIYRLLYILRNNVVAGIKE
jgi:hypothetical protein